eukprot:TRINITY_DN2956_c0_g1_i1.p1 TRINITY_DN2956_c0_g1~~TRINITY_DN2956_c0_g1_i1.p1  ORF type:complete len:559 (+),score=136.00 TRINITY_DN2956_c0_g1_i1:143-1819(+)
MGQSESKGAQRRQSVSAFLPSPKTDITSSEKKTAAQHYGLAFMQGWRAHMEDAHITYPEVPSLDGWSFYSVLDGHAGEEVAHYSEEHLLASVLYEVLPVRESITGIRDAMHRAFMRHDQALHRDFKVKVLKDRSGATCTSVLMTPTHYVFANLGDSRTLLCRQGKLAFQTRDHKPTLPEERQRIRNAGGYVINARVDGGLAISRAFGDFDYKQRTDLPPLRQKVIAAPQVTVLDRDYANDDFVLLACDGIFDVMSNQTCVKYVQGKLKRNPTNPKAACVALLKRCLELGSRDNMSACLVLFNKDHQPQSVQAKLSRSEAQVLEDLATAVSFNALASAVASIVNGSSTTRINTPQAKAHQAAQLLTPMNGHGPAPSNTNGQAPSSASAVTDLASARANGTSKRSDVIVRTDSVVVHARMKPSRDLDVDDVLNAGAAPVALPPGCELPETASENDVLDALMAESETDENVDVFDDGPSQLAAVAEESEEESEDQADDIAHDGDASQQARDPEVNDQLEDASDAEAVSDDDARDTLQDEIQDTAAIPAPDSAGSGDQEQDN